MGNESLLKHDRILLHEITGVTYCQLLSGDVRSKQRVERVENSTLFIFNDSIVCVDCVNPNGSEEYDLLCMIKFYSRSSCR
jgi:hypothetical protein